MTLRHVVARARQHLVGHDAGLDVAEERVAVREDDVRQRALRGRVGAAHGPHAGDVARVVPQVGRVVHQQHVAGLQPIEVAGVVPHPRVRAAAGDGVVALVPRAVGEEGEACRGSGLVLVDARLRAAHRLEQSQPCQHRCLPDQRDLALALRRAQRVEDGREVAALERWIAFREQAQEVRFARRPAVPRVGGDARLVPEDLVAALRLALGRAERRVERRPWRAQHGVERLARQPVYRFDRIDARERDHLGLVLGRPHRAATPFQGLVPRREEQRGLARPPVEHEVGVRRLEAGQVVELVRLAEDPEPIDARCALEDGDPVGADGVQDAGAPLSEFLGGEISLERGSFLGVQQRHRYDQGGEEQYAARHRGTSEARRSYATPGTPAADACLQTAFAMAVRPRRQPTRPRP